jgi:SET domain-containing protein
MKRSRRALKSKDVAAALYRVKPSEKDGVGVFALRNLKKGTVICDMMKIEKDYFVPWSEYKKIDPVTQAVIMNFCAQDGEGYYGPADLNYLPIPLHMNHSCDGNVGCDRKGDFVAIRNIKRGDELCFDYALVISNSKFALRCHCGERKCRKMITGDDWQDRSFQEKNLRYMSPLVRGLIK